MTTATPQIKSSGSATAPANEDKKQRAIENQMVVDALEEITAIYFDEERNEIYAGNNCGLFMFGFVEDHKRYNCPELPRI